MTWLEKMDSVLQCMYDHSGENPTMEMYETWLKHKLIHKGEIQDILLYLHKEQMIYCDRGGDRTHAYVEGSDVKYLISCKGKLFLESVGGFDKQNQNRVKEIKDISDRNKRMERNEQRL